MSLSGVIEGQRLPFPATHCQLFLVKDGTRGVDNSIEGFPVYPPAVPSAPRSWQCFMVWFGNRAQEPSMSGSIIGSASGPLMDGDVSWVMDLLISQGFFFAFFHVLEWLEEEIQCVPPFWLHTGTFQEPKINLRQAGS